ncbi:MAG: hypothetical protein SFU21_08800 [Flavihumibacter sp.]|nr:hypothetical protein [Flavihumibacter sp.]
MPVSWLMGADGGSYKPVKEVMNAVQFIQQGLPVMPTQSFLNAAETGYFYPSISYH